MGSGPELELDEPELGKLILERTAPSERLRRFLESASSPGSSTCAAVVENSASGERWRPPLGVGGALVAFSVPSCEKAMEGPASGEERCGREPCGGDSEFVLRLRLARDGRSGMVSLWSAEGRRGGEGATGEGAASMGLGEGWKAGWSDKYYCYKACREGMMGV